MRQTLFDRSAPGVRVSLLEKETDKESIPLDLQKRLIRFTFEDSDRKADKVLLELENHDLSFFEQPEYLGGTLFEVCWGYPGNMSPKRRVVVKKVRGFSSLTVEGRALSTLMHRESKVRTFKDQTRSQVAEKVAREYGYEGRFLHIEETREVFDTIVESGQTDAAFLRSLAALEDFVFFVDDSGFHFKTQDQSSAPSHVLTWFSDPGQGNILSIQVESNLARRAGRVTVKGRDPLQKKTIEHTANNESVERQILGEVIKVVDPETGETTLEKREATASSHSSSVQNEEQAKTEAKARYRKAERRSLKLSMTVVGDPSYRAKSVIELRGVPNFLAGKYYVHEVKHVISDSGYTSDLKLTKDATGRLLRRRQKQRSSQGKKNAKKALSKGTPKPIKYIDPETGQTNIVFEQEGRPVGYHDPEAQMSRVTFTGTSYRRGQP